MIVVTEEDVGDRMRWRQWWPLKGGAGIRRSSTVIMYRSPRIAKARKNFWSHSHHRLHPFLYILPSPLQQAVATLGSSTSSFNLVSPIKLKIEINTLQSVFRNQFIIETSSEFINTTKTQFKMSASRSSSSWLTFNKCLLSVTELAAVYLDGSSPRQAVFNFQGCPSRLMPNTHDEANPCHRTTHDTVASAHPA